MPASYGWLICAGYCCSSASRHWIAPPIHVPSNSTIRPGARELKNAVRPIGESLASLNPESGMAEVSMELFMIVKRGLAAESSGP